MKLIVYAFYFLRHLSLIHIYANYTKDHSDLPHPSFGSYMKELYKDRYGCLGITIGGGGVNAVTAVYAY